MRARREGQHRVREKGDIKEQWSREGEQGEQAFWGSTPSEFLNFPILMRKKAEKQNNYDEPLPPPNSFLDTPLSEREREREREIRTWDS